jgi:hypothetical protein
MCHLNVCDNGIWFRWMLKWLGGGSELIIRENTAKLLASQSCIRGREIIFYMEAVGSESLKWAGLVRSANGVKMWNCCGTVRGQFLSLWTLPCLLCTFNSLSPPFCPADSHSQWSFIVVTELQESLLPRIMSCCGCLHFLCYWSFVVMVVVHQQVKLKWLRL